MKEDGLSEFLKIAYKHNKVKDVSEAFEEYDVNEEWHKGKIENVVRETDIQYNLYKIGDIVFVDKYYYSNGSKGQNHFFVIIDQNNIAVPIENFGMLISSQIHKTKYPSNKLIKKDETNGLHKDSIVKTDEIYRILNEQIIFKIGQVDNSRVEEYKKAFYEKLKKQE